MVPYFKHTGEESRTMKNYYDTFCISLFGQSLWRSLGWNKYKEKCDTNKFYMAFFKMLNLKSQF